ncbi:MAG TPA: DUF3617 family protein [Caulobacteraceae bacterium]|jgi:hypothetical protein|nr:DUF3617 family protein [Caulobacteraceae bacterium]
MTKLRNLMLAGAAFGAASLAVAALAQSPLTPARRAGLWEQAMTMNAGGGAQRVTITTCVDAASERAAGGLGRSMGRDCERGSMTPIPGGWRVASSCRQNGQIHSMTGTLTGDFSNHIHMDVSQSGGGRMSMDMKYLGACPAGRHPGDFALANGMVVNRGGGPPH